MEILMIPWIGIPNAKTRLLNHNNAPWVFLAYLLVAQLKLCHSTLRELTFGQIVDQFLNSPVIIKITQAVIHVYLDPAFVFAFGTPFDDSS
jgi:hypothetical protein